MPWKLADWVDHARGVGEPATRRARQQHLDRSEDGSAEFVAELRELGEVMRHDAAHPAPEESVRAAKLIPRMEAGRHLQTSSPPSHAWGTATRELPSSGEPHNIRYQIDNIEIDLRVELRGGEPGTVIVGLVSHPGPPMEAITNAPVHLRKGGETLASTLTNSFGELHVETTQETGLELRILVSDRRRIDLPLPAEGLVEI